MVKRDGTYEAAIDDDPVRIAGELNAWRRKDHLTLVAAAWLLDLRPERLSEIESPGVTVSASEAARIRARIEALRAEHPRRRLPVTRAECPPRGADGRRICGYLSCRHHLATDLERSRGGRGGGSGPLGDIGLNPLFFEDGELRIDLDIYCALDAVEADDPERGYERADRGHTLMFVGGVMGVSRERVRQIEADAIMSVAATGQLAAQSAALVEEPERNHGDISYRKRSRAERSEGASPVASPDITHELIAEIRAGEAKLRARAEARKPAHRGKAASAPALPEGRPRAAAAPSPLAPQPAPVIPREQRPSRAPRRKVRIPPAPAPRRFDRQPTNTTREVFTRRPPIPEQVHQEEIIMAAQEPDNSIVVDPDAWRAARSRPWSRLRLLREAADLEISDIAQVAGVPGFIVGKVEAGLAGASTDSAHKVLGAWCISHAQLTQPSPPAVSAPRCVADPLTPTDDHGEYEMETPWKYLHIGQRLCRVRSRLGLTQSAVGKLVKITGTHIGNMERGVKHMRPEVERKIMKALRLPSDALRGDVIPDLSRCPRGEPKRTATGRREWLMYRTDLAPFEHIELERLSQGWQIEDLAKQAGLGASTVRNVERGQARDESTRAALRALGCDEGHPLWVRVFGDDEAEAEAEADVDESPDTDTADVGESEVEEPQERATVTPLRPAVSSPLSPAPRYLSVRDWHLVKAAADIDRLTLAIIARTHKGELSHAAQQLIADGEALISTSLLIELDEALRREAGAVGVALEGLDTVDLGASTLRAEEEAA